MRLFLVKDKMCAMVTSKGFIPLIKAISLDINGGIDLGSTWKYEYTMKSGNKPKHSLRQRNDDDSERVRIDEEKLRVAEQRLRKHASNHRHKLTNHMRLGKRQSAVKVDDDNRKDNGVTSYFAFVKPVITWLGQFVNFSYSNPPPSPPFPTYLLKKKSFQDSKVKDDGTPALETSRVDSGYTKPKTTTKPLARMQPKTETENVKISEEVSTETQEASEFLDGSGKGRKGLVINGDPSSSSFESGKHINILPVAADNRAIPETTTPDADPDPENTPTNPHKVKDDELITEFTNYLYEKTMNLFDKVKKKTDDKDVRRQIKNLARSYNDKFKEYLRETKKQTIETKLETQKIILSTIETSDRILRRLLNFMIADMDSKGTLRNDDETTNTFKQAIETEKKTQLARACKKFGLCRTGPVFSNYLTDIMSIVLKLDSKKFNQSINSFFNVLKTSDFENVLDQRTESKLKLALANLDVQKIRPLLVVLKNIIMNKNMPFFGNYFSVRRHVMESTYALVEIIDSLDYSITADNLSKWSDIKNNVQDFADGKRNDIYEISEGIVANLLDGLKSLSKDNLDEVTKNLNIILP